MASTARNVQARSAKRDCNYANTGDGSVEKKVAINFDRLRPGMKRCSAL